MYNTIDFIKRGCDFWDNEPARNYSDICNYRITTTLHIPFLNGRSYYLEIRLWRKQIFRETYKRNPKKKLKKPVYLYTKYIMYIDNEYETSNGSFRDMKLLEEMNKDELPYTRQSILNILNKYTINKYYDINLLD